MRKTILLVMMAGYMALLVLLLATSWLQISSYQENKRQGELQLLQSYLEKTREAMDSIDGHLYDVYAYNADFNRLSGLLSSLENYRSAYELREAMQSKLLLEEAMHGYFIYYDHLSHSWYNVNNDIIKAEDSSALSKELRLQVVTEGSMRKWFLLPFREQVLLAVSCRKGNVAVAAVHSLGDMERQLSQSMGEPVQIVLISGQRVLQGDELESQLNLREKISDNFIVWSGRVDGHYVYAARLEKTDLWVCMVRDYNFWSIMGVQQLLLLAVTLISLIAVVLLYVFVRREFLHPLRALTGIMNRIRAGEIQEAPVLDTGFRELRDMSETMSAMVSEIERHKLTAYEEVIERQRAQMQYLQLQLKPHFYLNGLKTLNALAVEGEAAKMQELIVNLSAHLRYLLQSEREVVPLLMEVEFTRNYVELQKHVTGREVRCEFRVEEAAESWQVPVLCIQTFVENSVKYAKFGSASIPLLLSVSAELLAIDGERFVDITVTDNGQGYPEEMLRELNGEAAAGSRYVGINNIKRRCRLLYGERAEYRFGNDRGAVSELILPGAVELPDSGEEAGEVEDEKPV
ncbi:MAG: sensor histidine kinase [Oscillospiraceae bacterium]